MSTGTANPRATFVLGEDPTGAGPPLTASDTGEPFPAEEVKEILARAKTVVDVEMNYSEQLGGVIKEMTCFPLEQYVLKYNGRPMSQEEVYDAVRLIADGTAPKRVVLKSGA